MNLMLCFRLRMVSFRQAIENSRKTSLCHFSRVQKLQRACSGVAWISQPLFSCHIFEFIMPMKSGVMHKYLTSYFNFIGYFAPCEFKRLRPDRAHIGRDIVPFFSIAAFECL